MKSIKIIAHKNRTINFCFTTLACILVFLINNSSLIKLIAILSISSTLNTHPSNRPPTHPLLPFPVVFSSNDDHGGYNDRFFFPSIIYKLINKIKNIYRFQVEETSRRKKKRK